MRLNPKTAWVLLLAAAAVAGATTTAATNEAGESRADPGTFETMGAFSSPPSGSRYYFVSASGTFSAVNGSQSFSYSGGGCLSNESAGSLAWIADLQVESGETIIGVRFYIRDDDAAENVTLSIFRVDTNGDNSAIGRLGDPRCPDAGLCDEWMVVGPSFGHEAQRRSPRLRIWR